MEITAIKKDLIKEFSSKTKKKGKINTKLSSPEKILDKSLIKHLKEISLKK